MPKPADVNPRNFSVHSVLYDDGDFSIAAGVWEDGTYRLAMRWNGDDDAGYPKTFGHPVWFMLPETLTTSIIGGILTSPHTDIPAVLRALSRQQGPAKAL